MGIYLAVTDTDPAPLNLSDGVTFDASWDSAGPAFSPGDTGTEFAVGVRILPPVGLNWNTLARKLLTDTPRGQGLGAVAKSNLVLLWQEMEEGGWTYWDVLGVQESGRRAFRSGFVDADLVLLLSRYGRGAVQTFSGLTVPTGGGGIWLDEVPGNVPALARLLLTDTSTNGKRVVSVQIGQHASTGLVVGDTTPRLTVTPQSPGVAQSDATAFGGSCARLTAAAAWQSIGRGSLPATGRGNRLARVYAKLRRAAAVMEPPRSLAIAPSPTGGTLTMGIWSYMVVPYTAGPVFGPVGPVGSFTVPGTPVESTTEAWSTAATEDFSDLAAFTSWVVINHTSGSSGISVAGGNCTATATYGGGAEGGYSQTAIPAGATAVRFSFTQTAHAQGSVAYVSSDSTHYWAVCRGNGDLWYFNFHSTLASVPAGESQNSIGSLETGAHTLEFRYLAGALSLYVNDVLAGTIGSASEPVAFGIVAAAQVGGTATNVYGPLTFKANATMTSKSTATTYSAALSWLAPAGGVAPSGYRIFISDPGGVTRYVDVASPSYSHTSPAAGTETTTLPGLPPAVYSQVRAIAGVVGGPGQAAGVPILLDAPANQWVWRDLGPLMVPPVPPRWGQSSLAPFIEVQAANAGSAGDTVDCDAIAYVDEEPSKVMLERLDLGTQAVWDLSTRPDGLPVAAISAGSGQLGAAAASGGLRLGPGPTHLVILPSTAATNPNPELISNTGFETNTAGWTNAISGTIARSTAQHHAGSASLLCTSTGAGIYGADCALTLAAATAYVAGAWVRSTAGGGVAIQITDDVEQALETIVVVAANTWTWIETSGTTDAHTSRKVRIYQVAAGAGETLYIDEASCKLSVLGLPAAADAQNAAMTLQVEVIPLYDRSVGV